MHYLTYHLFSSSIIPFSTPFTPRNWSFWNAFQPSTLHIKFFFLLVLVLLQITLPTFSFYLSPLYTLLFKLFKQLHENEENKGFLSKVILSDKVHIFHSNMYGGSHTLSPKVVLVPYLNDSNLSQPSWWNHMYFPNGCCQDLDGMSIWSWFHLPFGWNIVISYPLPSRPIFCSWSIPLGWNQWRPRLSKWMWHAHFALSILLTYVLTHWFCSLRQTQ